MISEAFANSGSSATGSTANLIPFILVFLIFYLLLIRPQQKKLKEHGEMVKNLKVGNKVLTGGGIIGKVTDVDNEKNLIKIKISQDVEIEVLNHTITSVVEDKKEVKNIDKKKIGKNKK